MVFILEIRDQELLVTNKITAKHIPNHWESIGIEYLSYYWLENETQFAFDHPRCFAFINDAIEAGEAVLVHSIRAFNCSIFVVVVYLMHKYMLQVLLEDQNGHYKRLYNIYIIQKNGFEIKSNVFQQLLQYERWFRVFKLSQNWDIATNQDEILARNTYTYVFIKLIQQLLDYIKKLKQILQYIVKKKISPKQVQWKQNIVSQIIPPYHQIEFKKFITPKPIIKYSNMPIKLKVYSFDNNYMKKNNTLNQIVDEQLSRKLNQISVKSDRQSIKPLARPATAPSNRLLKGKVQTSSLRLLVKQY
ncbi:unnamed protein product [Paramecium sonneborni]|uniref:Tyrosine-protein phosphatase domain-containing protein n=1 Tax=Paramecium sonneborni TaxID=65129 RepID=A0A8S1RU23_9CILI|nr:unnamed protein product [Paramecium sonneborni]